MNMWVILFNVVCIHIHYNIYCTYISDIYTHYTNRHISIPSFYLMMIYSQFIPTVLSLEHLIVLNLFFYRRTFVVVVSARLDTNDWVKRDQLTFYQSFYCKNIISQFRIKVRQLGLENLVVKALKFNRNVPRKIVEIKLSLILQIQHQDWKIVG